MDVHIREGRFPKRLLTLLTFVLVVFFAIQMSFQGQGYAAWPGEPCTDDSDCESLCFDPICRGDIPEDKICSTREIPCDDTTDPCLFPNCDEDQGCFVDFQSDGASCTDGIFCNGREVCDGAGNCLKGDDQCAGWKPFGVEVGPCTEAECDEDNGCTLVDKADGSACDDEDPCTAMDSCEDDGMGGLVCRGMDDGSCPGDGDGDGDGGTLTTDANGCSILHGLVSSPVSLIHLGWIGIFLGLILLRRKNR